MPCLEHVATSKQLVWEYCYDFVDELHIQRIVLATEGTTVTQQISL